MQNDEAAKLWRAMRPLNPKHVTTMIEPDGIIVEAPPTHNRFKNLVGKKYGRLEVESYLCRQLTTHRWKCRCECGSAAVVTSSNLLNGNTLSCGCLLRELRGKATVTHGFTRGGEIPAEYRVWNGMKKRCYGVNSKSFHDYGRHAKRNHVH